MYVYSHQSEQPIDPFSLRCTVLSIGKRDRLRLTNHTSRTPSPAFLSCKFLVRIRIFPTLFCAKFYDYSVIGVKEGVWVTMSSPNGSLVDKKSLKQQRPESNRASALIYDLILWTLSRICLLKSVSNNLLVMVDIFFREIRSRGSYRIPRRGAVIFVAAPHANQVQRWLKPRLTLVHRSIDLDEGSS